MANLLIEPVFISLYTANNEDPLLRATLTSIYEFGKCVQGVTKI